MDANQAAQVADLINRRNHLPVKYTADKVLKYADKYILETDGEQVIGCVRLKQVQWYQTEICHLAVVEDCQRRGVGTRLIEAAEAKGASVLQCTIRSNNKISRRLFEKMGFREAIRFKNSESGNEIIVYQKVKT